MIFIVDLLLIPPLIEDIKTREIRNLYFLSIVLTRFIQLVIERDREILIEAILGFLVVLIIMLLCMVLNRDGIGMGDIKILLSLGFACGIKLILSALFYISLCSALFSIILLATKKASKNTELPFMPFVFAGMLITTLFEVIV